MQYSDGLATTFVFETARRAKVYLLKLTQLFFRTAN